MGRDKALLPYRGTLLVKHIAGIVLAATGRVALIGDPARYSGLGYSVYADEVPDCGPLGGICTALSRTETAWNLMVACDMPDISVDILRSLLEHSATTDQLVVAAMGQEGEPEPLCAVYHRECLPVLVRAMENKRLRMKDLLRDLGAEVHAVDPAALANVNTAGEWAAR